MILPKRLGGRAGRAVGRASSVLLCLGMLAGSIGCLSFHEGPMPGEPKNATYIKLGDTRVRYVDRGSGPPVVLLHGFASALETWATVMPKLLPGHRVVALDLKGFGWTDRPEGDYSPDAQAKLVLALLDELRIDRATFVAHSWGSSVALAVALRAPERVSRIALYDAWVYEEQLPTTFIWARTAGIGELLFALFYKERPDDKMAMAFYDPTKLTEPFVEEVEAALDRPQFRAGLGDPRTFHAPRTSRGDACDSRAVDGPALRRLCGSAGCCTQNLLRQLPGF